MSGIDPYDDPALPGNARRIVEAGWQQQASVAVAEPVQGVIEEDAPRPVEDEQAPACSHLPSDRRLVDGEQVCVGCGEIVVERQGIVARDRPGTVDPTVREGDARAVGGLRHITYDPAVSGGARPYTPDEVEREIVDTLDRIERGAGYLTTKEEQRAAAKLAYELAFARARFTSKAKTVGEREDDALLQCRELYSDWQLLDLTCRTAREGLHNLRAKLSGLQSVARSIGVALGSNRG